jgi:outer membrane lipoprotein-sorting protein
MKFKIALTLLLAWSSQWALALTEKETADLVALVDDRQRNTGDFASTVFMDQKEKDGTSKAYEARVYRRDADDKWLILFTKPKTEAGKGYLRLEKNLFLYEPAIGKWERQTERASIVGTGSRRDDFDESRLAEEFTAKFVGDETLGKFKVYHLKLTAKPKADVANPIVELWVDQETKNILKRQESALSGKLLRTSYYPSWDKMFSKSKNAEVYVPREIRVFDEVEKGNQTSIVIKNVNLDPLPANMFTKAWVEAQSR